MSVKSLESLLKPGSGGDLGGIVQKARDLADLTESLKARLPEDLAEGLLSVNLREDALVLVCSSSAWAARLRFEEARIREASAAIGRPAAHVVVRVARGCADQA
jgi:hypothetical protein